MWNFKLCMNAGGLGRPADEAVGMLAAAGFDGFFVGWNPGDDLGNIRRAAEREHMMFQSVHAPFNHVNRLWQTGDAAQAVLDEQLACLRQTAEAGVDIMVTHTFIGFRDHTPTPAGPDNYRILLDEAARLGVRVALENTEGEEYLDALMTALDGHPALADMRCATTTAAICLRNMANISFVRISTTTSEYTISAARSPILMTFICCRLTALPIGNTIFHGLRRQASAAR